MMDILTFFSIIFKSFLVTPIFNIKLNFNGPKVTRNNILIYTDQYDKDFKDWEYTISLLKVWFLPELILGFSILVLITYVTYILIIKKKPKHTDVIYITKQVLRLFYVLSSLTILLAWLLANSKKAIFFKNFLLFNFFTLSIKAVISILSIFIIYLIKIWYMRHRQNIIEIYILFLGSIFFSFFLVSSTNLFFTYLSLEGISMQSYTLAIFSFTEVSIDIVLKYFLLGSLASGILLYGISLIYGVFNTLDYISIKNILLSYTSNESLPIVSKLGILLLFLGLLFKVGAYPMHVWVPGVYRNSPTPITIFFATIIKFIMTLLVLRLFYVVFDSSLDFLKIFFLISAVGSMVVGALGAFKELKVKNFISYTAINQAGFIMLGLCCQTTLGIYYALYYLFIYILLTIGFLSLILNLFQSLTRKPIRFFKDLKYFCKNNTSASLVLSAFILSFAGLPPFAGFFGKLYMYFAIAQAKMFILLLITLLLNIISLYYYIRIIKSLWFENLIDFDKKTLVFRLTTVLPIKFLIFIITLLNIFFLYFLENYDIFINNLFSSMLLIN